MARTAAARGGRARGSPRRRGSRGPSRSLVVTLQVRAPLPPHQLPTPPESTHLSPAQRESLLPQAAGIGVGGQRTSMAPVRDPNNVDDQIKDVIQLLFEVQSAVHGYLPETQGPLVDKITDLTHSLSALRTLAASPTSSVAGIELPPEILDYVDGGRNPDVYTREFVELVQRGNAVLNGKQDAFKTFSEVFAQELASAMPETEGQVDRVMRNAGLKRRRAEEEDEKMLGLGQQKSEAGGGDTGRSGIVGEGEEEG